MDTLLTTFIIAISLSMDAFSLALIYGTLGLSKNSKILLSLIVGLYHFFMPIFGLYFGSLLIPNTYLGLNYVVAIIFILIGMGMIITSKKDNEEAMFVNILAFLTFGFSVSIDSFTTGIGLNVVNKNYYEVGLVFFLISAIFTYAGLNLGNVLSKRVGFIATIIGGILLILLGIRYIFQ